jgi:hypothetical protein
MWFFRRDFSSAATKTKSAEVAAPPKAVYFDNSQVRPPVMDRPTALPMDRRAFGSAARLALVWTGSMTLLVTMVGTLVYSAWWHGKREDALKQGQDPDQWFDQFDRELDPVSRQLRKWGWMPSVPEPSPLTITDNKKR